MKEQLDRVEKELIEQEHRPIKVITNYLKRKQKWPDDEEKQLASKKAILWRLFFSPGVVATVGGGLALLSLIALIWQNRIIFDQNILIGQQNQFLREQLFTSDLRELKELIYSEEVSKERRKIAIMDFIRLSKDIVNDTNQRVNLRGANLSYCEFVDEKELFRRVDFDGSNTTATLFAGCDLRGSSFNSTYHMGDSPWGFIKCDLRGVEFKDAMTANIIVAGNKFNQNRLYIEPVHYSGFKAAAVVFDNDNGKIETMVTIDGGMQVAQSKRQLSDYYLFRSRYNYRKVYTRGRKNDSLAKLPEYDDEILLKIEIVQSRWIAEHYDKVNEDNISYWDLSTLIVTDSTYREDLKTFFDD